MRVALVIAGPYPAFRGSQVLVSQLDLGLRERGHDVSVVSYGRRGRRPGLRPERLGLDAVLVARLWRCVRRRGIEVIHAHNYEAALAGLLVGRATGRSVVYHGHSAHADELPLYVSPPAVRRWMRRLGGLLDRHIPRRADACIAVSADLGARLRAAGVPAHALLCLEPTVCPAELDAGTGDAGEDGLVCYAGNLDPYQGLDVLLHAFARVRAAEPAARLRLVSHPEARGHAARLVSAGLGAAVEIVLAASYEQVRDEVRRAAVTVCPRSERSGFPMKLLTYMALGRATVACAGSAKGLVDGVTARVVADHDAVAFAGAVLALLRDPGERERLGAAARRAVEHPAAWESALDRIESIYQLVSAAGRGRRPSGAPVAVME